jgi:hypothetical protein
MGALAVEAGQQPDGTGGVDDPATVAGEPASERSAAMPILLSTRG